MSKLDECLDDIFREVLREFPDDMFDKFKTIKKDDLWQAHFGFGTWLKSNFLNDNPEIRKIFENHGISQVDDMSFFVIEKFQAYLKEKN